MSGHLLYASLSVYAGLVSGQRQLTELGFAFNGADLVRFFFFFFLFFVCFPRQGISVVLATVELAL